MFLVKTKQNYYIRYKLNPTKPDLSQTTTGTTSKKIAKIRLKIFEYGGIELLKICIKLNIETFGVNQLEEIKSIHLSEPISNEPTESNVYKPLTLSELQSRLKPITNNSSFLYIFKYLIEYFSKDGGKGENIIVDTITIDDLYNEDEEADCYYNYRINAEHRYKKETKISLVSFKTELRHFRIFFKKALEKKLIKNNLWTSVPFPKIPKFTFTVFDKDERKRLIECISDELIKNVAKFALIVGARRGEIINACWNNCDFENKTFKITNTEFFTTKNLDYRIIPMNSSLEKLLLSIDRVEGCPYIFNRNGKKLTGDWLTKNFKKELRANNFDEKLHLHSTRGTLITSLIQDDYDIFKISRFIGHRDIQTTIGYSRLNVEDFREMSNNIKTVVL